MSTLERAIAIAAEAHAEKIDKGGAPYILHPLRVMLAMTDTESRIVAVLHDVVEDHSPPWTLERIRSEGFSKKYQKVVKIIATAPPHGRRKHEPPPQARAPGIANLRSTHDHHGRLAPSPDHPGMPVLEHFPEKWIPVFRKEMRQVSNLERFPATAHPISWST